MRKDFVWFTGDLSPTDPQPEIPSPCQKVCRLDEQDVCTGCGRTINEIARWTQMTNQEKLAVWERLGQPIE